MAMTLALRRRRAHMLLGAAAILALAAAPAGATTLEQALALTYASNPQLESARDELRQIDERVPAALSGYRPTVRVTGSTGVEHERNTVLGATETRTPTSASLELDQPLFRGGRTVAGVSEAENLVRAQRARLASVEQDVFLSTVEAFTNVARDAAVVQLTTNNEQVLARQLTASSDRFEVGEVTRTDVAQSESRVARATAQRVQAEGDLIAARAVYQEVVGEYPDALEAATAPADLPASEEETVAGSENSPDVIFTQFVERAAVDRVKVIIGELLPALALEGTLLRERDAGREGSESDSAALIARLTVPLYTSGSVDARVREAKARVFQRRDEIERQRRAAAQIATSSWQALETARARIVSFEAEVRAAAIAREGTEQEAIVGARTVLDILDAEQEYLDAQVNLVRAKRDEVVAAFRVLAAVGRLTAPQIGLPVEYYDAEQHYREVRGKLWGVGPAVE